MQIKWTAGLLAAVFFSGAYGMVSLAAAQTDIISDGVYIGDQDVGGMTVAEVEAYIEEEVQAMSSAEVTIRMGDDQMTSTMGALGLKWENTDLINEISQLGTTGNIVRRYMEQKDLQNQSAYYEIEYELDEELQREFVESCAVFNSEPVEGTVYLADNGLPAVEGGTDGLTLDVEATLASLQEQLAGWESGDTTVEAVVDRESPVLTADMLSQMSDVLGTATTDYSASSAARAQNVENGTAKINGTLLMPGEGFSVTSAVAPFTAENGYDLAPSYEAGQVVESYGGGICQVSTTLYNAVLKAELEVDQRSNHTMLVTYVDPSKDAAIAEGVMDFVFTNDTEYPIYIVGSAYYGTLNFTIFGVETRPANRSIEFVSETLSQTDPASNITLVANTSQSVGYLVQTSTPHQGLSAVLWKKIYVDGVLQDTIQVNSSNYQATAAIYEVGVVTDNTALSSALYTAIAQNDLTQVQYLLTYGVQTQTETQQSETQAPAQTPETTAPAENTGGQTSETTAPQVTDPAIDGSGEDVTIIG